MKLSALPSLNSKLATLATGVLAVIFVLLPFHALLTVSISALTGHYNLLRLWKEVLLLLLTPIAVIIVCKTPGLWKQLRSGWLFWAIACYVVLHIALGLVALAKGQVNSYALLFAWISNLRPMLIFVLAYVIGTRSSWLRDHWIKLLIIPAGLVIAFGLLQAFVLPSNILTHLNYGTATIEPYSTVDNKTDYIRIQSSLRGPNPLGAYLVLALGAMLVVMTQKRLSKQPWNWALVAAGVVALFMTYSRSAYIGLFIMILAIALLLVRSRQAKQRLAVGLVIIVVVAAAVFAVFRDNDRFENTFFHTNEQSQSALSSNNQRTSALQSGIRDVASEPFGRGPGTAGPASVHNLRPARITEDYYLQIGQETGWLGLGLFVAIVVMIGRRLWRLRADPLARMLLVTLVGISFINLVQHAWGDDTLALLWWGFAGVALAPILKRK